MAGIAIVEEFNESKLMDRVTTLETNYEECCGKVTNLKTDVQMNKGRLDGFGKELKILLAEINIIAEWIFDKFDVQLIDKQSFLYQHLQDLDEVEDISNSIKMTDYSKGSKAKKNRRSSYLKEGSSSDETSDEEDPLENTSASDSEEVGEVEAILPNDLEYEEEHEIELVVQEDLVESEESTRPRRTSRRKINYKEFTAESSRHKELSAEKPSKTTSCNKKGGRKSVTQTKVSVEPTKLPKRGRPKKPQSEKIENWKTRLPVQCDECGKIFKGAGSLRTHKMIHVGSRPFECKQCGKAFRRKHHLEFHLMVHAGDKKLQCRFCGKLFHIQRDLLRHERTHTGEKPFACHLCPKTFNIKPHLTMHIRTHTGEKPYKCSICEKCFSQSNSLRIHKKIHFKVPNPNIHTPSSEKKKPTNPSLKPRKPKVNVSSGSGVLKSEEFKTVQLSDIDVDQTDGSVCNVDEGLGAETVIGKIETPTVELNQQTSTHLQSFHDPVQQAWRMAIAQPLNSQNLPSTISVMTSRIDNSHPGQIIEIRNTEDRSSTIPTPNATFSITQFYDPNIRYFSP